VAFRLQRLDSVLYSLCNDGVIFTPKLQRGAEYDLDASWSRPVRVPVEYLLDTAQTNRHDRHFQPTGDQTDTGLESVDFPGFRALTFRKV
jgi:hypothetical protein